MTSHEKILEMRTNSSYSKHNKDYWSKENDKELKKRYNEGYGISEMALEMGRTENSISKRIKDLKLDAKRYNTKSKKYRPAGCLCNKCEHFKSKRCSGLSPEGRCNWKR